MSRHRSTNWPVVGKISYRFYVIRYESKFPLKIKFKYALKFIECPPKEKTMTRVMVLIIVVNMTIKIGLYLIKKRKVNESPQVSFTCPFPSFTSDKLLDMSLITTR